MQLFGGNCAGENVSGVIVPEAKVRGVIVLGGISWGQLSGVVVQGKLFRANFLGAKVRVVLTWGEFQRG